MNQSLERVWPIHAENSLATRRLADFAEARLILPNGCLCQRCCPAPLDVDVAQFVVASPWYGVCEGPRESHPKQEWSIVWLQGGLVRATLKGSLRAARCMYTHDERCARSLFLRWTGEENLSTVGSR